MSVRFGFVTLLLLGVWTFPSSAQEGSTTTVAPPATTPSTETTATTVVDGTTTTTVRTTTTLSEEERRNKAEAAGNLNAALAADIEIATGLQAINEAAQATQSKIDAAKASLKRAQAAAETARIELIEAIEGQAETEAQLRAKAVEGFKSGPIDAGVFFTDRNMNQSLRQSALLQGANRSTSELLEDLRSVLDDQRLADAEARQAAEDAAALEQQLTEELAILTEQHEVQSRLKREAESRIAKWESELSAYAAEDQVIQQLIADSASSPVVQPLPREPSELGYQWPVIGTLTSGYGYRIHPVYGTRKLHAGLDVAAPRGTPISATGGGIVIFAGWRGGYGNTVIVDHGGGITSLYGHMSEISVSENDVVNRGNLLGLVGATGTATGNHLHFEIRYDGVATDPAPYLP